MPLVLGVRYPLAALRSRWSKPIEPLDVATLQMRVHPTDCDLYLHVNNGRYLSLMDIGRIDHAGRSGLLRALRRNRWHALAGGATIRFRRELRIGHRYRLHTRCVGWDDAWSYWEQVFERSDGQLAARAYAKLATIDRSGDRVAPARVMEQLGRELESPALPPSLSAWLESEHG